MKGTIDVQIKHKDGSIETRRENNVVFDIPALILKKSLEHPEISRVISAQYAYDNNASRIANYFKYVGLSEDIMNLEKPEFRPMALRGRSLSASYWWESVPTITTNDTSLVVQNTWTVQQALTLKSIGFLDNTYPGGNILRFIGDEYSNSGTYLRLMDGKIYGAHIGTLNGCRVADLKLSNFKFTNSYMGGLLSADKEYVNSTIPYRLANPNERAAYTNTTFVRGYKQYPYDTYTRLCIYDKSNLDTPLRYFDLSQFSEIVAAYDSGKGTLRIINTGTKNYLIQFYSSNGTMVSKAWQIPDESIAEDASIPLASSNFMDSVWPSGYSSSYPTSYIVSNCVFLYYNDTYFCVRVNDDLSVYAYKAFSSHMTDGGSHYGWLVYLSLEDSGLQLYSSSYYTSWPYSMELTYIIYNKTAANFSTPITLAEGDVLTISYKIEVA